MLSIPEVWQRGPIKYIPSLLQPVAHALLQAKEEIAELESDILTDRLWDRPAGVASPGFHLLHLSGVLDRIFTYARAEVLSEQQLNQLLAEGNSANSDVTVSELVLRFNIQVDKALDQLRNTNEGTLTDFRGVGRKQLPSTVIGLLVHAAEHTMRHVGQLRVTVKVLAAGYQ